MDNTSAEWPTHHRDWRWRVARAATLAGAALFRRAVPLAHEAALLPWRIADAEQNLRQAEAAAAAEAAARG
ncbi:MAG TPA: hypothetical protein VGI05_17795 [Streptosporangiaceae bacterium]|jgi:hypothetical protein